MENVNIRTSIFIKKKRRELDFDSLGRAKLRESSAADRMVVTLLVSFAIITVYTVFFRITYKWDHFMPEKLLEMAKGFLRWDTIATGQRTDMIKALINTFALGFLTTVIGMITGIFVALLAARNLTRGFLPHMIRSVAAFMRAVPTIIWVLIFVAGYGLSATTAVVGMYFHTLAFFIKSFSESFEEVDEATIEALKATGANWLQIVFGAVLPSSATRLISWLAIRSEINFGVAVVIGPAVGVPGTIGTAINNASRGGDYATQGFGVFLVFLTAFILEVLINRLRQRSIV